jgi:inorganic pyrophosphatase
MAQSSFWISIDQLVASSEVVIDRPKGTASSRYPDRIYPLDYGFLAGTMAADGGGIDVWVGTAVPRQSDAWANAIVCTVDLLKRDSEMKILLGCTESEMQTIVQFVNSGDMRCILVRRE